MTASHSITNNQSINQSLYLQKAGCHEWDKQSIEPAAHDHKHNIKPEYKNKNMETVTHKNAKTS